MKFALIIVAFGIATGNSIISGSEIAVVPMETEKLCTDAEAKANEAFKVAYGRMIAVCVRVAE
jgi:hypothetical protein